MAGAPAPNNDPPYDCADLDGDGQQDADELGLAGWTILLSLGDHVIADTTTFERYRNRRR